MTANELRNTILQGLACEHVEVLGDDGQHFDALVVSAQFAGKNKVQQHQLVYQALGDRMRAEIHALAMRTITPEAWAQSTR
ncbi:BolA/IbaG family iron-sulfur metabolism protein [Pseudomonas sp. RTC3]|jgi:acid stress-induced BolA-like protein IbaG/YrbA|uniref:BolA family protein n=1 Tax=unclassified Pseudomonas TaxID=196821 RepID=UPI002AB570F0|nr:MULTISPECIES: BolA/IbaG family iron-sulfur metabolism protein [unclassified Pseudomonas]MEB0063863.1 BolA/IbaG family iron-sulfur metabolism protein [Pseudomonas sp. RTC3]MDY7565016.1 BolA/IbaG family iron-sulfur metabolism protein [Pseudomonas sp. 5C2]MEB0025261.1 BolA/IbaG family iron-sulfur metabolism protein [Pseudomonas sp. MH9.2]MEB0242199.1 BolA/IbaG family iron-sulfur metabolism protein [Pseudomonas sp. 5C2]WPX69150.1 BolA/IbaG family iron-sulfur metabolism protein [Pseudomonas sp. 